MSVEKVVATIETPTSHQGAARPDVKNSAVLEPARRAKKIAGRNETTIDSGDDEPVDRGQVHSGGPPASGGRGNIRDPALSRRAASVKA